MAPVNSKRGYCTNPECAGYQKEFITHKLKFYCPDCQQPLSEKMSEKSDSPFPWSGALIGLILGIVALGGLWAYTRMSEAKKEKLKKEQQTKLDNFVRQKVDSFELQKEFDKLVNPSVNDEMKETLLDEMGYKYLENTFVIHRDTALETTATIDSLSVYTRYLSVFSDKAALRIVGIRIDSIADEAQGTIVYVTEEFAAKGE